MHGRDITGRTKVGFIIGNPVAQVKTPAVFNDWAARTGADVVLLPLAIADAGIPAFFETLRTWENCFGCVVTYPFKQTAHDRVDDVSPISRLLGACNVVRRERDGRLVGTMTDGLGYIAALEQKAVQLNGADVLLLGAGGAGSAIAYEVARAGVARLAITDIDWERQAVLLQRIRQAFPSVRCSAGVPEGFGFDIVCNATPVGMKGDGAFPMSLDGLPASTLVTDIVPDPPVTAWLEAAKKRGHPIQTGPEMVAGQLAFVIEHLLGPSAYGGEPKRI